MSNQDKSRKRTKLQIALGIILGIILSALCRYLPDDYQAACNAAAEITAMSCGG